MPAPTLGHLLTIHHEAIPNFEGRDGSIGMNAHEMPFPEVDASVDLNGFGAGDAVSFTFEVDWQKPTYRVVRIAHLSADVELRLDAASPADPDRPRPTQLFDPNAERSYLVRGVVRSLPDASHPQREFMVEHEEIPDFMGANGTVGMASMTMRFPNPNSGASLEELRIGDVVEFRWFVRWDRGRVRDRTEDLRLVERPD
ncbi:MAG: copper-binding protein [Phycisphaeraceae bacterium]|nr:copper-binding protein [Phycisphaeraceae bacterium]